MTKFYMNLVPNTVSNICAFKEYTQNLAIMHELKNYRPKRRPLTSASAIKKSEASLGKVAVKRKRLLIVRDWFFFVVWANRIKTLMKAGNKPQLDRETKLREFQRLYSRLIQKQRPLHDTLRSGKLAKTEEASYSNGGSVRDVDDYFAAIEGRINYDDEVYKACKLRLMKSFADTKIAIRFQEFGVGFHTSNSTARVVNGQKKPLFELQISVYNRINNFVESSMRIQLYAHTNQLLGDCARAANLSFYKKCAGVAGTWRCF